MNPYCCIISKFIENENNNGGTGNELNAFNKIVYQFICDGRMAAAIWNDQCILKRSVQFLAAWYKGFVIRVKSVVWQR